MIYSYMQSGSLLKVSCLLFCLSIVSLSLAQEGGGESLELPPLIQVLIHSETLGERISVEQNIDDFADFQEVAMKVVNKWHNPTSIKYKAVWYTNAGVEIVAENDQWYRITILPKSTYEWEVFAPENGYDAIVHIQ